MRKSNKYNTASLKVDVQDNIIKREKPLASKITPKTYDKNFRSK